MNRSGDRRPQEPGRRWQDRAALRLAGTATTIAALVAVVEAGRKWR